jgi:hypothetical protein
MAQIVVLKPAHFFSLTNDIIDVHARAIGTTALAVYTALSRYMNRKTGECRPSISKLAYLLDLARNTVKSALRTLEAHGLIAMRRRFKPTGDATSHLYTLLDPTPQAVEARQRQKAAAQGTSMADPPRSMADPPGRSMADPEPDPDPLTKETNQELPADAQEETPQPQVANPCSHPREECYKFDDLVFCWHCKTTFTVQVATRGNSGGNSDGREEGQAYAACAAC